MFQSGCVLHAQLEIWKAACLETEIARASNDSPTEGPLTISVSMLTPTSPIPVTVNHLQPNDSNGSTLTSWPNNPASTPSSGEISDGMLNFSILLFLTLSKQFHLNLLFNNLTKVSKRDI